MHSRRPLPALALVMPHPQLPTRSSLSHLPSHSPRTPRACTPSTPVLFPKQLIASPRTSTDSWGSSTGNAEDDVHWEWKPEQMNLLVCTLDALPGHLYTPFNGPVPPSNLLDKIARSVSQAQGPLEWPHSVRATRAKLVEIARARDKDRNKENFTIDERDEDDVVEVPPGQVKKPLYRQSSMDFLPSKGKGNGTLSRLSSRLQRADRIIPTYHPYARPPSRSPSPPALRSETRELGFFPVTPTADLPILPRTLRPRTSSNSLLSHPPQGLQRSMSDISTFSDPFSGSIVDGNVNARMLTPTKPASIARVGLTRRSESFSCAAAATGPTLKRAPSFGASSIASASPPITEKQPPDPESDEEEKVRQTKVKRPRTRSTQPRTPGVAVKTRDKKPPVQKENTGKTVTAKPATKAKSQPRTRSGSMFGPELPQPQPKQILPRTSPKPVSTPIAESKTRTRESASPPPGTKTLRRVKTTTFKPAARRISFGSLPAPAEEQVLEGAKANRNDETATPLGSAFQMA